MSDLDLAALTEAVKTQVKDEVRVCWGTDPLGEGRSLDHHEIAPIVRAVLEALFREWGAEVPHHPLGWRQVGYGWTHDRSVAEEDVRAWREDGHRARLVWRAVGPPVPAEDA